MSSFKPIDGSKEDFRKYLDRKGVLDAITKVLIKCNSDRPENAIEYLLDNLGEKLKDKDTIARLQTELNDARNEVDLLRREIESLKVSTGSGDDTTGGAAQICTDGVDSSGISTESNSASAVATIPAKVTEDAEGTTTAIKPDVSETDSKTSENPDAEPTRFVQ